MTKKKTIAELVEETVSLKALIIGGGSIADYLVLNLKHHDCQAVKKKTIEEDAPVSLEDRNEYDYIFLFGKPHLVERLVSDYLSPYGKLLFIETDRGADVVPSKKVRILRAGDLELWSTNELADKVLRTMFSSKENLVVDVCKVSKRQVSYKRNQRHAELVSASHGFILKVHPEGIPKQVRDDRNRRTKKHFDKKDLLVKKISIFTPFRVIFLIFLILFMFAAGTVLTFWKVLTIKDNLSDFRSHVASSNWQAASDDLGEIRQKLQLACKAYDISGKVFFPFKDTTIFQEVGSFLSVSDRLAERTDELLLFLDQSFTGKTEGFSFQKGLSKSQFYELTDKTKRLEEAAISAKRQIDKLQLSFIPKESFSSILTSVSENLISANEMVPFLEEVLFNRGAKVYLVLFQNNMELRPTGGFIGSFALITLQDGKIGDIKIEDVYTADGQLKGHVDPPVPIRKYLSQPHFFLRDSNFDPDFAVSANKAAWFLEKELGSKVDGVIGVNLFFIQDILRTVKSINLSDFNNEEITADDFFIKANSYSQDEFFPGSTQKKDFLTSVANALINKLSFGRENIWFKILPAVKRSLEEKNILIYSFDESLQKLIEEKGFGGRASQVKCIQSKDQSGKTYDFTDDKSCLADYLFLIETNLGVNKANYFIEKSTALEKRIGTDGKIASVVTISYENSAVPEIHRQATYVNYLRVLIPAGSVLKGATFNARLVLPEDIDVEDYGGDKKSVGFLVKIAPGEKSVVKIAYTFPQSFEQDISSYQLFFQKQGGDKVSPFVLSIIYPSNLKLKPVNFNSTSGRDEEIYYTTDTSVDRVFAVGRE